MAYENPKLIAWKAAEDAARKVEREVRALLMSRAKGEMVEGLENRMAVAGALRQTAHQLLDEALRDIKAMAEALRHRNRTTPTIRPFEPFDQTLPSDGSVPGERLHEPGPPRVKRRAP